MAPKVTVLKVSFACDKCKVKLLKAVAGLEGVNKIEADEEKGTLTVAGLVDPHVVIVSARKAVKCVEIVSVGDPKKPETKDKDCKKPETKDKDCKKPDCCPKPECCYKPSCHQPYCGCKICQLKCVAIPFEMMAPSPEPTCRIM